MYVSQSSTANLCAIDVSRAFCRVNHFALRSKLMKRLVPVELLILLDEWSVACYSCIRYWDGIILGLSFLLSALVLDKVLFCCRYCSQFILYDLIMSFRNKKYVLSNSESVQCNFFIFDHVTFIQFKICCCVQNFIKIGWFFTEIWRYIDFQNGGRSPSWNCVTTIWPPTKSLCCWPQLPVKFHVNLIHIFEFFTYLAWNAYSGPQDRGFRGLIQDLD